MYLYIDWIHAFVLEIKGTHSLIYEADTRLQNSENLR